MIVGGPQQVTLLAGSYYQARPDFEYRVVCGTESGAEGDYHSELTQLGITWQGVPDLVRELRPVTDLKGLVALVCLFHQIDPAIVHARSAKARLLAPLAARLARVPVVVQTVHGWSFNNAVDSRKPLFIQLEKLSHALCHCSVFVSEKDYAEGVALGIVKADALEKGRAAIIRSGIDLPSLTAATRADRVQLRAALDTDPDAQVVSLIQRLSEPKTPLVFVEAMKRVAAQRPKAILWIVGDGKLREPTERAVADSGLAQRARFLGMRKDVPALIAASDLVVHSSLREGLPRVVLETLHAGTPLVATSVGGVPEVVRHCENGLLVAPSDPVALAFAILEVLEDPAAARRRAEAGRAAIHPFSAARMLDEQHALYSRLLNGLSQ